MKLKLDLLPNERKSIKRDYKAWYILAGVVLFTLLWYIPVNSYIASNSEKLNNILKEENIKLNEARVSQNKLNTFLSLPLSIDDTVKFLVDFLSEPSYSWYKFFDGLENANPGNLWISNIENIKVNEFHIDGEARDNYRISEFYNSLMQNNAFSTVYLLRSEKKLKTDLEIEIFEYRIYVVLKEEAI
ncbi:MAG: PilN domain-containing protein [Candidatus Muiribacteriota bacterium]